MVISTVAKVEPSTNAGCVKGKPRSVVLRTLDPACLSCSNHGVGDGAGWWLRNSESGLKYYTLTFTDFCLDNGGKFRRCV